jgi:hypothetical protein
VVALWENLGWQFADSIPGIKAPDTVGWKPRYELEGARIGGFILFYKLFVIAPALSVLAQVVSMRKSEGDRKPIAG